jgi:hypothetical protein
MSRSFLKLLLACISGVFAVTYYVEPAPVSPYSCTATQPCRIQDLPSSFTTADQVVFLPKTTGQSSTYASGTKTFTNPSVVLSAGITFNAYTLNVQSATSVSATSPVIFQSASALNLISIGNVALDGATFTNSQLSTSNCGTVALTNSAVSGMTGTRKIQVAGNSVTVNTVSFTGGSTSVPALIVQTGTADSTFDLSAITVSGCTTTGANSAILMQSINGKAFSASADGLTFSNTVSGSALFESKIAFNTNPSIFSCSVDILSTSVTGGSVAKGVFFFNNGNNKGTLDALVALTQTSGVSFNGNAIINLNANTAAVNVNGWNMAADNNFCASTSQPYFAICSGTTANANILMNGNVEGSDSLLNCGPNSNVNMGNSC